MIAFIIGNGTSREHFDLQKLRKGTVFGCNALYRVYEPDYLVAIDDGIIDEINEWGLREPKSKTQVIFPPYEERWEPAECNPNRPRSNAGVNAMLEAIKRDHTELYCLGFDFLIDGPESISNMFDGTPNYTMETRASIHDGDPRTRYLEYVANTNANVKFYFVFPSGLHFRHMNAGNCRGMFYDDFEKMLFDI